MSRTDRRLFLKAAAATAATLAGTSHALTPPPATQVLPNQPIAPTDPVWREIQRMYELSPAITNLENGYWGAMPRPVLDAYLEKTLFINRYNTAYARTRYDEDADAVRASVAQAVGAEPEEIALTRGATEALQKLIAGYNKLQTGDVVMYADLDYDSMQYAMNWLKARRGVEVQTFAIPEPATHATVLETYRQVLATPGLKLLLLTHLSHRTGLVMPVAEIARMARDKGVDIIVDAAHSWGQIDFDARDLGVPFIGFNLHKWISAPVGVGFMYIAKERLADIDLDLADEDYAADDIRARIHTGTSNFAAILTVPRALQLHQQISAAAKQARLTHLRNYWVDALRNNAKVQILTPDDPRMHAGITAFRFNNATSKEDNNAIVATLHDQHQVLTVRRGGIAAGHAIRVSPALYTTEHDLDRLVAALNAMS